MIKPNLQAATLAEKIKSARRAWLSRALFALGPFIAYIYVEILNENSPFKSIELWRAAWNIAWYIVIFSFFWLLCGRRRRLGAGLAALLCLGFGVANHYVLRFRGTMLFPIDLLSMQTAANVAGGYDYTPDTKVWLALGIFAAYIALLLFLPRERRPRRARLPFSGAVALCLTAFLVAFFCTGLLPAVGLYAEQWATQKNGFTFNFMLSLRYSFVSRPDNYSGSLVSEIEENSAAGADDTGYPLGIGSETQPTNVIVIMNESFADLSIFENLTLSKDPLEFWHSMSENTVKGWMYSPVYGGGTANVEYEVLTGNSSSFLPNGTVAYQLYVDTETPSLASIAGSQGYTTYSFHPYLASGWNRIQAYNYLGFDNQLYEDDVEDPEYVRRFISDECDFKTLTKITEEDEGKTFIFNVTMQNHSGYALRWTNLQRSVRLVGDMRGTSSTAEQYFCLMDESDSAFEWLINYYESCDEPTLIVMFGDHQPPLENSFYDQLYGNAASERSSQELLKRYMTPFVIWANYDIEEKTDVYVGASFLHVLIANSAGFESTGYVDFLGSVMDELVAVHDLGCVTSDNTLVTSEGDLTGDQRTLLDNYRVLAYYDIFDREKGDSFFEGYGTLNSES